MSLIAVARIIHIIAGTVSLLCGLGAIVFRKKIKFHRPFGKVYFWSMTIIFFSSIIMSVYKSNLFLLCVGFFTYYSCITALRSLKLKKLHLDQKPLPFDWFLEIVFGLAHVSFISLGIYFMINGNIGAGIVSLVFGIIGIQGNISAQKRLRGKITKRNYWLLAHIGGMLGSYIGALTAFLVNNGNHVPLPPIVLWLGPTFLIVPLILIELRKHEKLPVSK